MHTFRTAAVSTAVLAAMLLPATAGAAEYDHSQTIVVGPAEQPAMAAHSGSASGDAIVFNGRGSYHSVGMSQYGARGQAAAGRTAGDIMSTYYVGTSIQQKSVGYPIRVAIVRDTPKIRVVARGGQMVVRSTGYSHTVGDSVAVDVTVNGSGKCTLTKVTKPGTAQQTSTTLETGVRCPTFDPDARAEVRTPNGSGWDLYGTYGGAERSAVVDLVADQLASGGYRLDVVVQLPLEQYLYGLAEVPYSWEQAALRAQAIAGRSYAMHRMIQRGQSPDSGCSCHVWDSQQDQVYRGYEREISARWADWKTAVDATSARVVMAKPGQEGYSETADGVVQAFYSASSHGRTENKHEVFYPSTWDYMVTVEDGWSLSAPSNPYADWSVSVARSTVAQKVGLPSIDSVTVTERRASGSAKTVVFRGGGQSKTLSGDQVRWTFGLWSNGFGIGDEQWGNVTPPPPSDLFTDDDDSVHEDDIDWLGNSGITKGCNPPDNTLFCPRQTVTRGQMAAFLVRALDLPAGSASFEDTSGSVFEADIAALAKAGITKGCNPPHNTRYCPDDPVTREQMATFLTRALDLPPGPSGRFTDVPESSVHAESIAALAKAGITVGCNPPNNTRFCPGDPVTREQMATFLKRALA